MEKKMKELLLGSKRLNELKKPKKIKGPSPGAPDVSRDIQKGGD